MHALLFAASLCFAQDSGLPDLSRSLEAAGVLLRAAPPLAPSATPPADPNDPCAKGVTDPNANLKKGDASGSWAETSVCLPYSIDRLWAAAQDQGVRVFERITKIKSFSDIPAKTGEERRVRVEYESRSRFMGMCHTAWWPMEWSYRRSGSGRTVSWERTEGGDFNGSFIKRWVGRVELVASSPEKTVLRMRFEMDAPTQTPDKAGGAVVAFIARLTTKASGGSLPGAASNPDCPY